MEAIRAANFGASVAGEGLIQPVTGITCNLQDGLLDISHRGRDSTLDPETGKLDTIVDGLPVWGESLNPERLAWGLRSLSSQPGLRGRALPPRIPTDRKDAPPPA